MTRTAHSGHDSYQIFDLGIIFWKTALLFPKQAAAFIILLERLPSSSRAHIPQSTIGRPRLSLKEPVTIRIMSNIQPKPKTAKVKKYTSPVPIFPT